MVIFTEAENVGDQDEGKWRGSLVRIVPVLQDEKNLGAEGW